MEEAVRLVQMASLGGCCVGSADETVRNDATDTIIVAMSMIAVDINY